MEKLLGGRTLKALIMRRLVVGFIGLHLAEKLLKLG